MNEKPLSLTHAQVENLLAAYTAGETTADEHAAVARHLAGCARCRQALAEVQQIRALLRGLGHEAKQSLAHSSPSATVRPVLSLDRVLSASSNSNHHHQGAFSHMESQPSVATVPPVARASSHRSLMFDGVAALLVAALALSIFAFAHQAKQPGSSPGGTTTSMTVPTIYTGSTQLITPVPGVKTPISAIGSYRSLKTIPGTDTVTPQDPTDIFSVDKPVYIVMDLSSAVRAGDTVSIAWFFNSIDITTEVKQTKPNCCSRAIPVTRRDMQVVFSIVSPAEPLAGKAEISYNGKLTYTVLFYVGR